MGNSTADQHDQHGRPTYKNDDFARDIIEKIGCSQHRLCIVLEVLQDEEMGAPKGAQDGSKSALENTEHDDFARDILKQLTNATTSF